MSNLWDYFSYEVKTLVNVLHATTDIRVELEETDDEISFIIYGNLPYKNKDIVYFKKDDDLNKLNNYLCEKLDVYLQPYFDMLFAPEPEVVVEDFSTREKK